MNFSVFCKLLTYLLTYMGDGCGALALSRCPSHFFGLAIYTGPYRNESEIE